MQPSLDIAKTHEIMAKFRPIAPKPPLPPPDKPPSPLASVCLQARPCRARKRGRNSLVPATNKRPSGASYHPVLPNTPPLTQFRFPMPRLPPPPQPVEQDLLKKLQEPKVITPRAVRPVGSSITVASITEASDLARKGPVIPKRPEEVEEEVESETLPAVISDSNNRVRLANSAYKEMVGQPVCPWLEEMESSMPGFGLKTRAGVSARRINGEVVLEISESLEIPSGGCSCRVKVEWACNGRRSFVDAPCDVIRLCCESKDYLFTWKIHTAQAFETNCRA